MVKMINNQIKNKDEVLILEPTCEITQFLKGGSNDESNCNKQ